MKRPVTSLESTRHLGKLCSLHGTGEERGNEKTDSEVTVVLASFVPQSGMNEPLRPLPSVRLPLLPPIVILSEHTPSPSGTKTIGPNRAGPYFLFLSQTGAIDGWGTCFSFTITVKLVQHP